MISVHDMAQNEGNEKSRRGEIKRENREYGEKRYEVRGGGGGWNKLGVPERGRDTEKINEATGWKKYSKSIMNK